MPTRSKFAFRQGFLMFWSTAAKMLLPRGGGGMCMLFEICAKRPFPKCMGRGVYVVNFEHGAVNGTRHRAQAMLRG